MTRRVDVCIIGAGSAGLYALGQASRHTHDFLLVNAGPLGTTCARVGCMPSKVLIQAAGDIAHSRHFAKEGIHGAEGLSVSLPEVLAHVRELRDGFADGPARRARKMGGRDRFIEGEARFLSPGVLEAGGVRIEAKAFIIAVGSRPVVPRKWRALFGEERLLTTDTLFEQEDLPPEMAVLGMGVIGLEMGQALARLGVRITGVDMLRTVGGLTDEKVARAAIALMEEEFPLWLGAPAELEKTAQGRIRVRAGERAVTVEKVLVALGRRSNADRLNLAAAGVETDAAGLPEFDRQTMRVGETNIFIAGDANGENMTLHETADEGRIAGWNAGLLVKGAPLRRFRRKARCGIVFCEPNIAVAGRTHAELCETMREGEDFVVGERDFSTQSRAKVMLANRGLLRLYARKSDGLLLGAEMCAPGGEHLAHHLAWAIERGAALAEMIALPYYHPVLEEGLQNALHYAYSRMDAAGKVPGVVDVPFA